MAVVQSEAGILQRSYELSRNHRTTTDDTNVGQAAPSGGRKGKLLAELPQSIPITIARTVEPTSKMEKLENEKEVADDLIESSDISDEDDSF